jgi:hypothetical protein
MSNNSRINPMLADTASDSRLVSDTTVVRISRILVKASNATWAVILKDGAGNIIFDANQLASGGTGGLFILDYASTGLVVNTLTAATAYIYTY